MIQKLRRKFVLITMALVSVVLLAVFAGIVLYYSSVLRADSYRSLEMASDRMSGDKGPNFQLGGKVPDGFGKDPTFVALVNTDGTATLLSAEHVDVAETDIQTIADAAMATGENRGELKNYNLRFLINHHKGETKIAFMLLSLEQEQLRNVMMISGLGVAGALLVFLMASMLLSKWVVRPVERAWQQQRRFVADASHELKTPLTVILANTDILKSHPGDTIEQQLTWVQNTEEEARRMKELVEDMLFLAKGDDMAQDALLAETNISEAVATTALAFEPLAFEQGRSLELDVQEGITALGHASQIKQLVSILVDNAIKYSDDGSAITLTLKRRAGQAELAVCNKGRQITPEEAEHIFDRFFRADPSRSEQGYGLGLSIAKAIAERHHGDIRMQSSGGRTTFTVTLPLK